MHVSHSKNIEFCGRQELPLRSHRDSGFSDLVERGHKEVFKAALRLRLECANKKRLGLFLNAPRNTSYLSWKV